MARKSRRPEISAHTAGVAAIGAAVVAGMAVVGSLLWRRNREAGMGDAGDIAVDAATAIAPLPVAAEAATPAEESGDFTVNHIDGGEASGDANDMARAPEAFRPNRNAAVPDDKRAAFAPATMGVDAP